MSYFLAVHGAVQAPFGEQLLGALRIHVKTQHELPELIQALTAAGLGGSSVCVRDGRRAEDHLLRGCRGIATGGRIDLQEWSSGVHLHVGYGHHLPDFPGKWSNDLRLHFHGLEHSQAVPNRNRIAGLDENGNHYRRRRRIHHAPVISIDPVRHTVNVDQVTKSLDYGDDTKTPSEDG